MTVEISANPFPREAVVTHGKAVRHTAMLRSMKELERELGTYLSSYQEPSLRYGAALGICGEHGSGKTHVLNWLAGMPARITHSDCAVLYAKADTARILDIYRHVVRNIDRPRIIDLLQRGLLTIAREEAKAAEVMIQIVERLDSVAAFDKLVEEGTLDRSRIENLLRKRLEKDGMPVDLVRTLMDCAGPSGEAAYHWLCGDEVTQTAPLGIVHKFSSGAAGGADADNDDTRAFFGLTLFAALHEIAEIPFVLMIDQLEVLLRTDPQRFEHLSSLTKRLSESFGAASAMLFFAGTDEGWMRFPRDVFPRLSGGAPLRVGSLSAQQVKTLIDAYTLGSTAYLSDALERLLELSGGSPREILRISHLAFKQHGGKLQDVTPDELLRLARESSTIADRSRLALEMIDQVVEGRFEHNDDFVFDDTGAVDRLIRLGSKPIAAVKLLRAADLKEETEAARALHAVSARVRREWPDVRLIAVTVGYASTQVRDLLQSVASVMEFNEEKFRGRIETELALAVTKASADTAPDFAKAFDLIAKRLDQMDSQIKAKEAAVDKRYAEAEATQSAAESANIELRTRVEILDHLSLIEKACIEDRVDTERGLTRALLVSNEVHRKDVVLDQLGIVYLDLLTLALRVKAGVIKSDAPLSKTRLELLNEMRSHLNSPAMPPFLGAHPVQTALLVGTGAGIIAAFSLLSWGLIPMLAAGMAVSCGLAVGLAWYFALSVWSPVRRWRRRAAKFAEADESRDDAAGISSLVASVSIVALFLVGLFFVTLLTRGWTAGTGLAIIPPLLMMATAVLIPLQWRNPFEKAERMTRRITTALITIAALATLLTVIMSVQLRPKVDAPTDTAATDTSITYGTAAVATDTMATDTMTTISTTDTSSTMSFDTSGTTATSATSGTSSVTHT